jgi:hypothetical protein
MAAAKTARRRQAVDARVSPDEVEREFEKWRERLHSEGAVKASALEPKALKDAVVERLLAEGHEQSGTWVRKPVLEQVRQAFAQGAALTSKALGGLIRGTTSAELERALTELERRGELFRVLRGKTEAFARPDAGVLPAEALRALNAVVGELARVLTAARRKKGLSLLGRDVEEALARARAVLGPTASDRGAPKGSSGASASALRTTPEHNGQASLLEAIDATRDERTGLSFVPRLVERLLSELPLPAAHQALLAAAREEVIELRPEGGLGRLTSEELELCPPGPDGTRLSWARRLARVS